MFLNNYCSENEFFKAKERGLKETSEEWLCTLSSVPLAQVEDKMRASVPSYESMEPRVRQVSPRDIAERIMLARMDIARDMCEMLEACERKNGNVLREALERTVSD